MAKREIPEINAGSMADIAFLLLIFFLVTTTMEKDTAYVRKIPKKLEVIVPPDPVEERNICDIRANNQNQLLFRGIPMEDPDLISDKVLEFYQMNQNLNQDQTNAALKNLSYKGQNFPFYSFTSRDEIEQNILSSEDKLDEISNTPGAADDMIEFSEKQLDKWLEKQTASNLLFKKSGKRILREIHFQAHVRVEVMAETEYELFAKIQSEVEEAIFELRDIAAKDIFGESYGIIKKREAMDKLDKAKDGRKLELLEVLYPARIIEVKPN